MVPNRKDCTPEETVSRIKSILEGVGITTAELNWCSYEDRWHSVRIEIESLPGVGMNGKGITKQFALASAYGELIERIQTGMLIKDLFWRCTRRDCYSNDQEIFDISRIDYFQDNVIKNAMDQDTFNAYIKLMEADKQYRTFVPFFNITQGKKEYLPIKLIEFVSRASGTCAGNTSYEALVHGICEILERHVHKEIFRNNLHLPTIPLSKLTEFSSYSHIEALIRCGYLPIVKDCSLGGMYPVVGVLLVDPSRIRYCFRIASDPDFDIALQRCITEMFQGAQFNDNFRMERMTIIECNDNLSDASDWTAGRNIGGGPVCRYGEWQKALEMGMGRYNISIFHDSGDSQHFMKPFIKGELTNKEAFEYLAGLVSENGYEIYIRNCSYLGFPVYKVYIPGLSEFISMNSEEIELLENKDEYIRTFMNLGGSTDRAVEKLIAGIKKYREGIVFESGGVIKYIYPTVFKGYIDSRAYDRLIEVFYHIKKKEFGKAFDSLMDSLQNDGPIGDSCHYTFAMLIYLKNRAEDVCEEDIKNIISNIYGQEVYQVVNSSMRDIDTIYRCFGFPSCPDCGKCAIQANCLYEEWRAVDEKLCKAELEHDFLKNITFGE